MAHGKTRGDDISAGFVASCGVEQPLARHSSCGAMPWRKPWRLGQFWEAELSEGHRVSHSHDSRSHHPTHSFLLLTPRPEATDVCSVPTDSAVRTPGGSSPVRTPPPVGSVAPGSTTERTPQAGAAGRPCATFSHGIGRGRSAISRPVGWRRAWDFALVGEDWQSYLAGSSDLLEVFRMPQIFFYAFHTQNLDHGFFPMALSSMLGSVSSFPRSRGKLPPRTAGPKASPNSWSAWEFGLVCVLFSFFLRVYGCNRIIPYTKYMSSRLASPPSPPPNAARPWRLLRQDRGSIGPSSRRPTRPTPRRRASGSSRSGSGRAGVSGLGTRARTWSFARD